MTKSANGSVLGTPLKFLVGSLLLTACTSVPTVTDVSGSAPLAAQTASSQELMREAATIPAPTSAIESAEAVLQQDGRNDRLQLSVVIKGAAYQTQRLELNEIKSLKAWVKGPGISGQINNLNDFISVLNRDQATTLDITQVPRGRHRVVTVQGYRQEINGVSPELAGATLKAVYDSPPAPITEVVLNFNWRSTLEAEIIEALLAMAIQNPEVTPLLDHLDQTALGALLDKLIYGNQPVGSVNYAVHPERLSAAGLAQAIVTAAGEIPAYTLSEPVPAAWQKPVYNASLTIRTPVNTAFLNSEIQIQITDPASAPVIISNGSDTALIPKIVPGNWDAIVSIAGLNGGVSTRATVTVHPDGTATLSAGLPENPIILPPVLKSIDTRAANAGQITINGDGFDASTPNNNLVKFGDTFAEVVSASAVALVINLPPGASGTSDLTVTVNAKTSNRASVTLPVRVVSLDSLQGVIGDLVTLTVSGYDPTQIITALRFQGSTTDAEVLATTSHTIQVRVPVGAVSGPITLTPAGIPAFTSPTYTIGNTPSIQSLSTNGPYPLGQTFTITGTNLADASTNFTIGGASAMILSKTINAAGQNVLSVYVTGFWGAPANSEVVINTPGGTAKYTPHSTLPSAGIPPTISQVIAPDLTQPAPTTQLVGQDYLTVSRVSIGGVTLPTTDYTIIDDQHITIHRLPVGVVLGPIKVTNPGGSASASLTYKNVVNYIGPTATAPNVEIAESYFDTLHGINVDRNHNIYTVDLGGTIIKFAYDPLTKTHARKWTLTSAQAAGSKEDIANDLNGNLYVANTGNNAIQKITVTTDGAGNETPQISTILKINSPEGIETDADGNLYVSSTGGGQACIYKLSNLGQPSLNTTTLQTCNGIKTTPITGTDHLNVRVLAGGTQRYTLPPASEPIASAQFGHLEGLGIDGQGHLYIVEVENSLIRRLDPQSGQVTIFANMGQGTSVNAPRMTMHEIRVDRLGHVFVPSSSDGAPAKGIYHISPEGKISLIAGNEAGLSGLQDGDPLQIARFMDPRGIDFGPDGTLYVAEGSWGVRKIERYYPASNLQVP